MTGLQIKRARRAKGISRVALAEHMDVSQWTVVKWEQGVRNPCCKWCMRELKRYLGVKGGKR